MITVRDGHRHKGRSGSLITIAEYEGAGWDREPSGHIFEQVRYKRFERWFHPYSGEPPIALNVSPIQHHLDHQLGVGSLTALQALSEPLNVCRDCYSITFSIQYVTCESFSFSRGI